MNDLTTLPHDLFISRLLNGDKEFFSYIRIPEQAGCFSWQIQSGKICLNGERVITDGENKKGVVSLSVLLPSDFESGVLTASIDSHQNTWNIHSFEQPIKFRLPLEGQVLVLIAHRIGETHRSALQIPSQQFGWDLLPMHNDGLCLLNCPLSENLTADHFAGFGQAVFAPADGRIVKAVDGMEDLTVIGQLPANMDYYLEDLNQASGNHVIIEHGHGICSCMAHLRKGSVCVKVGQDVKAMDRLGELGNSGFSSGPHLHLHFMNGPDLLNSSPLPVELELEGGTYAPQAGEITSS